MGGAHRVTVGDGGQPLHVRAEQLGKCLPFRVAQFRELRGHVRDGAMMLADLDSMTDFTRRRGVSGLGQRLGKTIRSYGRPLGRSVLPDTDMNSFDDGHHPTLCKLVYRIVPAQLAQLTEGRGGEVVV